MYISSSIQKYLDALSSRQPTPGGGSATSLCSALGVALLEMVCNFTLRNERYKDVESDVQKFLNSLRELRKGLSEIIDEDVKAYNAIREAFKQKDKKIIDNTLKDGYHVCLKVCAFSRDALAIALGLSKKGNINLMTDVGCGAELSNAAFKSSILNCKINLRGVSDANFVESARVSLDALKKEVDYLYKKTISNVDERVR